MEKKYKVLKSLPLTIFDSNENDYVMVRIIPGEIITIRSTDHGLAFFWTYKDVEYEDITMVGTATEMWLKNGQVVEIE